MDFAELRRRMVQEQLVPRGIEDARVLDAMGKVPREQFVPDSVRHAAYEDCPQSIGDGQTISQPYMVALMTQRLALSGHERVLEVGTGSGYQAAVLAEIGCSVYSIEYRSTLSERASHVLAILGYDNVTLRVGDGSLGWPEESPFDRIIVTAGAPDVPSALKSQLVDGGILVIPVGGSYSQELVVVRRDGEAFKEETVCGCVFVRLLGEQGWAR